MIKKHILALASLASLGAMAVAQADEFTDNRWYVAPFGSYVKPGGDRNSDDAGYGAGMGIGKIINEHFNIEFRGFYQGLDDETKRGPGAREGKWDLTGGSADLQYYFNRNTFAPYAVIGAGGMNTYVNGKSGVGLIGEAGLGFTYEVSDNFLIRSDVRYRYNNNLNAHLKPGTDEFHDMVVNVGFVIPFGPKPGAAPAPEPAPVAPDCSALDTDSDGVNDCLDKCPDTISGSQVDAQGCPIKLEIKGVNFRYDSAELTPEAMSILDGVADSLIKYPEKTDLEVQGYTSSEGSNRHNLRLSQHRSQSVADYLSSKGVTNKMTARGFGEDNPIADNSTEEGRERNRRVELIWMGN